MITIMSASDSAGTAEFMDANASEYPHVATLQSPRGIGYPIPGYQDAHDYVIEIAEELRFNFFYFFILYFFDF